MDELEKMKALWFDLNEKISALEVENRNLAHKIRNQNFKSAKERLIKKYNAFIAVEFIMILYIFAFVGFNPLIVEKYRIATVVYWTIFFIFEISIDFYLKERLKAIDIYNSSLTEISSGAAKNWKIHKIAIIIGFPLAIGACVLFAFALDANKFTIYGMIAGGLIGAIIGIAQLRKFIQYYRLLQTSE